MRIQPGSCAWCGLHPDEPGEPWGRPCEGSPSGLHDSAAQLLAAGAAEADHYAGMLEGANALLLEAARQHRLARREQQRRRWRRDWLPRRPDDLAFEAAAAKISDSLAVHRGAELPTRAPGSPLP